jgi:hypothetical protein
MYVNRAKGKASSVPRHLEINAFLVVKFIATWKSQRPTRHKRRCSRRAAHAGMSNLIGDLSLRSRLSDKPLAVLSFQ